jgi:hypothetical protein
MRLLAVAPLLLAVGLLASCTEVGSLASLLPTSTGSAPETAAATSTATDMATPQEIFACDLVSVADIESLSPFETPFAEALPEVTACRYVASIDPPAERAPVVFLQIFDYVTPAGAIAGVRASRDNYNYDQEGAVKELAGLGDEAYSYGEPPIGEDRVIVLAASGRYEVHVELVGEYRDNRGPDVGYAAKVSAGTEISRFVFGKLP